MKKKLLLTSILSVIMCVSLIVGATFALFTSEDNVNIAVTSGNMEVTAVIDNTEYKTLTQDWTAFSGSASLDVGGVVTVNDDGYIVLDKIVPADGVRFDIKIENNSNVTIKYRTIVSNDDAKTNAYLFGALEITVNGVKYTGETITKWSSLDAFVDGETVSVEIVLPEDVDGADFMGKTCEFNVFVEAIQGNATTTDISASVPVQGATAPEVLKTSNDNTPEVTLSTEVLEKIANNTSAKKVALQHTEPVVEGDKITFKSIELVDEEGNIIDLESINNDQPITVKLNVGNAFNVGDTVNIYHDAVQVASVIVDADKNITYTATHFCEVEVVVCNDIKVASVDEFLNAINNAVAGDVIVANGVTVDINSIGTSVPGGVMGYTLPGDITIKGLNVVGSYRGGNYLLFGGSPDQEIVFEDCTFGPSGRAMGIGLVGTNGGVNSVVYNNCTFTGPIITNFVDNPTGVATFNNCTITKATGNSNYVMAMGGVHNFNACTFDYTGLTQSNMGTINAATVNSVTDSDNTYSTVVNLVGCTRINCGTRKYGPSSTLNIK